MRKYTCKDVAKYITLVVILIHISVFSLSSITAFVKDQHTITVVDVTDLTHPKTLESYKTDDSILNAVIYGRLLFINLGKKISVLTINDEGIISSKSTYALPYTAWTFDVQKGLVAISSKSSLFILDSYFNPKGSLSIKHPITNLKFLDESHIIVILGKYGLALINVSNPYDPKLLWRLEARDSEVIDVAISQNFIYSICKDGLFFVVDISNISKPKIVYYTEMLVTPKKIFSTENYMVILLSNGEIVTMDIQDPFNPKLLFKQSLGNVIDITVLNKYLLVSKENGILIYKIHKTGVDFIDIFPEIRATKFAYTKGWKVTSEKPGSVLWTFSTGSEIRSSPVYFDESIFFASINGAVFSITTDGNFKWSYKTRFLINAPLTINNLGQIIVGSWDNHLYIFSNTGKLLNRIKLTSDITKPVGINKDEIYVSTEDGKVHLVKNGKIIWSKEIDGWVTTNIIVDKEGSIYFGTSSGNFYSLSYTGNVLWIFEASSWITSYVACDDSGNIYFGTADGNVYKLTKDGKFIWKYATGFDITAGITIDSFGRVLFGTKEGILYAIDRKGNTLWKFKALSEINSTPSVSKEGFVYFGTDKGYLYSLNLDGSLRFKTLTNSKIVVSPIILKNQIIFGGIDGKIYSIFDTTKGLDDGPWPTCCGNNQRNKIMEY